MPRSLCLIRHDISEYNLLHERKSADKLYSEFVKAFEQDFQSEQCRHLAEEVRKKYSFGISDHKTTLADKEAALSFKVGQELAAESDGELPDVIFVSPYRRALLTLGGLKNGWPDLEWVEYHEDELIREQEYGLFAVYNDWRIFHVLHPEQKRLYELDGVYWYRYPQGENVPDVRLRNRLWLEMLARDYPDKNILAVTHHLNILALRANLEHWSADEFARVNKEDMPINCGVTMYHCNQGTNRLELKCYNRKLF